ncbi:MAG: class I SAM-dependent methyltransferase [bacterium]|nr:class I SAM-dependent methyltransferase [bacterium]
MKNRKDFWEKEYKTGSHLALSDEPAEDLIKFTRWLQRNYGRRFLNVTAQALDVGCGNGRNLIFLAKEFGMRGVGYDISKTAIEQAKKNAEGLPLEFSIRSLSELIPLQGESVTLALDMMSSHVLTRAKREELRGEISRVLKSEGWLFFKSFLLDEDAHAKRLLKENPAEEEGMYIHPEIGVPEYVWTEEELRRFFEPYFAIHRIEKSHKHLHADGSPWKRRTISAYLEKT